MAMPTNAELAILRVLWRDGPRTVREVHQAIYRDTPVGYTSALKLMQNMLAKGLVDRQDQARQHVYAAAVPETATMNQLVRSWMDSAFAGSSLALAMQALDARPIPAEDLARLKAMIEQLQRDDEAAR
jgi:BlaI family transcriptional regulator, penicillinase repressor